MNAHNKTSSSSPSLQLSTVWKWIVSVKESKKMTNKSPIFHPHHFSDYGLHPQMDYVQVLEEAMKHKREKFPSSTTTSRSTESSHFKLQKPISKQESKTKKKQKSKWWRNALLFCKKKWVVYQNEVDNHHTPDNYIKNQYRGAPIYITESRSGSSTPCRSTWALIPTTTKSAQVPYLNLREMNLDDQHRRISTATNPMPIYLVT